MRPAVVRHPALPVSVYLQLLRAGGMLVVELFPGEGQVRLARYAFAQRRLLPRILLRRRGHGDRGGLAHEALQGSHHCRGLLRRGIWSDDP